jgi:hypothetical protein
MPVQQLPFGDFPNFRFAIADLTMMPDELARRYGLVFDHDNEDLGPVTYAAIALADGSWAVLLRHDDSQYQTTPVWVDAAANFDVARQLVLDALGLTADAYDWVAPESQAPPGYIQRPQPDPPG